MMDAYTQLGDLALLLGLSTIRLSVAFLLLPMFTQESLPGVVRNSLFVGLAVMTLAVQPLAAPAQMDPGRWMVLFGKEAFIGLAIGIFASSLLWAVESAGMLIDGKAGTSMGQMVDPLSGNQTSNTGLFLARLGTYVFMASGGFMFLVGLLLESYAVWPVISTLPQLRPDASDSFESALARMMLLMLMLAAPVLVVLFVADLALGLINRYAPGLNLLTIAPALKSLLAVLLMMMMLGSMIDLLVNEFTVRNLGILRLIDSLFSR